MVAFVIFLIIGVALGRMVGSEISLINLRTAIIVSMVAGTVLGFITVFAFTSVPSIITTWLFPLALGSTTGLSKAAQRRRDQIKGTK